MLNNVGNGRKEMMMILLLLVIFTSILLYKVLDVGNVTKYSNFRRKASNFITAANHLMTEETEFENAAYLYDLIEHEYSEPIESPFDSKVLCDEFESKVFYVENSSYVTLKCGEYAISSQPTTDKNYKIYKVSDWTAEKPSSGNFESTTLYNVTIDGKEKLDNYYNEREFLIEYYKKIGFPITSIYTLQNSKQKLVEKTFYRTYEQVS